METRTNKRSYWIQPMLVVGAILVAVTMANAVASTSMRSGITVLTVGDSYVGVAKINAGDSSVLGVLLPTNQTVGALFGRVEDSQTIAGRYEEPRVLSGSISTSGVHTGTVRNVRDTSGATTYTVTFGGSDTGVGTASSGHVVGETTVAGPANAQPNTTGVSVSLDPRDANGFSGYVNSSVASTTDTFAVTNIVSLSAAKAIQRGIMNAGGTGVDTDLRFLVARSMVANGAAGGAAANPGHDSRIIVLVYNQTSDSFISQTGIETNAFDPTPSAAWPETNAFKAKVRFETGINRLFIVYLGEADTSVGLLKKGSYTSSDSIGLYTGVVIISDTSATGNVAPGATATSTVTASQTATAQSDSTIMSLTGIAGSFILSATPLSPSATDVVTADSATTGETHLSTPIFDYTIFNASTGTQITSIAPGVLTITMIVRGNDTVHVVSSGFRILRQNITNGQWENYTGLAGVTVFPIGSSSLTGAPAVGLSFQVNTLPGDLMAVGAFPSSSASSGGNGGTCVLDKTLGGSIFAGSFGAIRAARDLALSTGVGRAFVALYYAIGFVLAMAFFGFVAKKVRA